MIANKRFQNYVWNLAATESEFRFFVSPDFPALAGSHMITVRGRQCIRMNGTEVWASFYFGISWFDSHNLISQDWTAIDKFIIFSILLPESHSHVVRVQRAYECQLWIPEWYVNIFYGRKLGYIVECIHKCLLGFIYWNQLLFQNLTIDDFLDQVRFEKNWSQTVARTTKHSFQNQC